MIRKIIITVSFIFWLSLNSTSIANNTIPESCIIEVRKETEKQLSPENQNKFYEALAEFFLQNFMDIKENLSAPVKIMNQCRKKINYPPVYPEDDECTNFLIALEKDESQRYYISYALKKEDGSPIPNKLIWDINSFSKLEKMFELELFNCHKQVLNFSNANNDDDQNTYRNAPLIKKVKDDFENYKGIFDHLIEKQKKWYSNNVFSQLFGNYEEGSSALAIKNQFCEEWPHKVCFFIFSHASIETKQIFHQVFETKNASAELINQFDITFDNFNNRVKQDEEEIAKKIQQHNINNRIKCEILTERKKDYKAFTDTVHCHIKRTAGKKCINICMLLLKDEKLEKTFIQQISEFLLIQDKENMRIPNKKTKKKITNEDFKNLTAIVSQLNEAHKNNPDNESIVKNYPELNSLMLEQLRLNESLYNIPGIVKVYNNFIKSSTAKTSLLNTVFLAICINKMGCQFLNHLDDRISNVFNEYVSDEALESYKQKQGLISAIKEQKQEDEEMNGPPIIKKVKKEENSTSSIDQLAQKMDDMAKLIERLEKKIASLDPSKKGDSKYETETVATHEKKDPDTIIQE